MYKVQPVNDISDESIHTLHRNMLFPFQSLHESETPTQEQNVALINANLAMMEYFSELLSKIYCLGTSNIFVGVKGVASHLKTVETM